MFLSVKLAEHNATLSLFMVKKGFMRAPLTSKFLVQSSNAECGGLETGYKDSRQLCSNIPIECSSKSYKFHSRSLLAREVFKRRFQDGTGRPCQLGDCQDFNMLLRVLDVCRKANRFISGSNLNEVKEKGETRYT